jgi:hypothetical protein
MELPTRTLQAFSGRAAILLTPNLRRTAPQIGANRDVQKHSILPNQRTAQPGNKSPEKQETIALSPMILLPALLLSAAG